MATSTTTTLKLDYGRSDFNVGQRFVTSLVYDLPVGRGKQFANQVNPVVNAVIGGWETSAIATFQQGFPMSIQCYDYDVASNNPSDFIGGLLDIATGFGINRCDQVGDPKKLKWTHSSARLCRESGSLRRTPRLGRLGPRRATLSPRQALKTSSSASTRTPTSPSAPSSSFALKPSTSSIIRSSTRIQLDFGGGEVAVNRSPGIPGNVGTHYSRGIQADPPNQRQVHLLAAMSSTPQPGPPKPLKAMADPLIFPVCWRPCALLPYLLSLSILDLHPLPLLCELQSR